MRIIAALVVILLAVAACGGDDDDGADGDGPTPEPTNGLGVSPPRHVESVTPADGGWATNESLAAEGVCAGFAFQEGEGMGEDPTSLVHMFVAEEDVTDSVEWVVTDDFPTSLGTGCYKPPEALPEGVVKAEVRFEDQTGRRFAYPWQFNVTGTSSSD